MGLCDPKAIRNGRSWADLVNQPGFMRQFDKKDESLVVGHLPGQVSGTTPKPKTKRDNTLSKQQPKE